MFVNAIGEAFIYPARSQRVHKKSSHKTALNHFSQLPSLLNIQGSRHQKFTEEAQIIYQNYANTEREAMCVLLSKLGV